MASNYQKLGPKPYDFVDFPDNPPTPHQPPGHHRYLPDHLHGVLHLNLHVLTDLHLSTGVVIMGSDIKRKDIPLIKTMVEGKDKKLLIQGSSLKGCIRSIYEAITNSRMGVKPKNPNDYLSGDDLPPEKEQLEQRLPANELNQLCPASVVFGASGEKWGWQGLISIQDAHYQERGYEIGYISNLHAPQLDNQVYYHNGKAIGRKFYYHMKHALDKDECEGNGIDAQVAIEGNIFTNKLIFKNLKPKELGTLLIALGQHKKYPLILKVGAGKPIGMGSIKIKITEAEIIQNEADLNHRYSYKSFTAPSNSCFSGKELQDFIQQNIEKAHDEQLIEEPQLKKIHEILSPLNNHIPYERY